MHLPCSALLACLPSQSGRPLVQDLRPSEMALDVPRRLVLPRRGPFSEGSRPACGPATVGGWASSRQARNTKLERSNPRSKHRRTSILPRCECLTGVLALFSTIQPHLGLAIAQSFHCHVLAFPGPRCAGWRLRTAGYEQSVKRSRACGSPLRIFRLSASHNLRTPSI